MKIAVIGAGYAGLAAAVELAEKGISVTVFEAAKQLGGRARRVDYNGVTLDNGQHILLGAYRETLRMMRKVGADPQKLLLRLPLQLNIPGHFNLQAASLPAPLHLAFGLLAATGLTWGERFAAVRFMSKMRSLNFCLADDICTAKMLSSYGQTPNLLRFLWEPLCLGALNTPLETASAQVFLNVLRDSLAGNREDSNMLLPLTHLTQLFPDYAATYVHQHGGKISLSQTVLAIKMDATGFTLEMESETEYFDRVICAIPPQRMSALTAHLTELAEAREQVEQFKYQPIYNIFLQYPETTRLPKPMIGLIGGITQWVFDRGQLNHEPGLFCAVISAEGPHQKLSHDELALRVNHELKAILPSLTQPLWHKVIADKRATFSCTPGLARPSQLTPLPNFALAGDYTASDYPATIESAVQSGIKAAKLIMAG